MVKKKCISIDAWKESAVAQILVTKVDFVGGEKDAEACKSHELDEVLAYKAALTELVKAVSIAHYLGKGPDDF